MTFWKGSNPKSRWSGVQVTWREGSVEVWTLLRARAFIAGILLSVMRQTIFSRVILAILALLSRDCQEAGEPGRFGPALRDFNSWLRRNVRPSGCGRSTAS